MEQLITAGQFAKLASTTKRTITWYDKQGILKPFKTDKAGYRYYKTQQILDFQTILLLRKLRFSIEEIKEYLTKFDKVKDLFKQKRSIIVQQIESLQTALNDLDNYYQNLDKNGTFICPIVKEISPFEIYYIEKVGSYSKIAAYGKELSSYFDTFVKNPTFLTIFLEEGYKPDKSKMKIAVVVTEGMKLNEVSEKVVKKETIPAFKALSYTHHGSGSLLSLLWQDLDKYALKNGYQENKKLPFVDLEFYYSTNKTANNIIFEINLPIA